MAIQSANIPDIVTLEQWKGLNQQVRRGGIDDQELWWSENLYPIGIAALRSVWGPSSPIYTAPAGTQILRIFFGYIGSPTPILTEPPPGRLGWMFLSNGNVDQVDLDTHQVTPIGNIWQDVAPYHYADAVVWRPRFFGNQPGEQGGVLFGSPKGLYAWDGTTLSVPGGPAPDWLTNFDQTGLGSTTMPTGLPGILCMEVYQGRLWVAGEDVISFSAPANGADFTNQFGGGSFGYSGNKLTVTYRDLAASAGYLFVYGDSSTDIISNPLIASQTVGDLVLVSSQFNYQNLDPQVGHAFPRKVGRLGRYMVLANGVHPYPSAASPANSGQGIWLMRGGDAEPIGSKITNLWMTLDTSEFYPTFATVSMFGARIVLLNAMFVDPWGVKRPMMLAWNQTAWTVLSQNLNLTHIGCYEQDTVLDAYGTDGTSLYHLFDHPDPTLPKRLSTKMLKGKGQQLHTTINDWKRLFMEVHDNSGQGCSFTGSLITAGGGIPNGREDVSFQVAPGEEFGFGVGPTHGKGIMAGVDLNSLSPDFTIERLHLHAISTTLYGA